VSLLLTLRADSHSERQIKRAVNSDKDVSIQYDTLVTFPGSASISLISLLVKEVDTWKAVYSSWQLVLRNCSFPRALTLENPRQNLQQATRRFLLHYYDFTCVCSSSILDATVKGAVPRGPRLLTSVDTATSLGTSGPKWKNSGQAHTWLKENTLYIALSLVHINRIKIKNGKH
jgi:hypothetical protein